MFCGTKSLPFCRGVREAVCRQYNCHRTRDKTFILGCKARNVEGYAYLASVVFFLVDVNRHLSELLGLPKTGVISRRTGGTLTVFQKTMSQKSRSDQGLLATYDTNYSRLLYMA